MKVKYIFGLAALAGVFTACDVTDKTPIDSLTDASYWKTPKDLELYANNLYGNLSGPSVSYDGTSDNCVTSNYSTWLYNESTTPASGGGWDWGNLRVCNFFMQRYQTVSGSEVEINQYVAEVRFFRALDYYGKIRSFGNVPWYDKDLQTSDTEELFKARDPRDMVLGKVIEDLEFAIEWLPEFGKQVKGRLTKDAARTQLARVCLYYGTYKKYHNESGTPSAEDLLNKAAALTDAVINTGYYDIVKGEDGGCGQMSVPGYPLYYSNLFVQEDLSTNKEVILARYYEPGVLTHELGRQASSSGIGFSKDFVESFLCKDGQPISVSPLYKGDETIDAEFENRDPRMYQLIDNKNKPFSVINGERQFSVVPNCGTTDAVTGYPCVKFRSADTKQAEARNTSYDWFVYRYAEVLLINAEAKAELGKCTQDVLDKTINKLRDRVEMPHLTTSPVVDPAAINYGYQVSPLLYEIRRERRIELASEGFRLDDLKRWNAMKVFENPKTRLGIRVTDAVRAMYKEANVEFGGENGRPTIEYQGKTYLYQYTSKDLNDPGLKFTDSDKRWLNPLPMDQLVLNKNLEQNAGWDKP